MAKIDPIAPESAITAPELARVLERLLPPQAQPELLTKKEQLATLLKTIEQSAEHGRNVAFAVALTATYTLAAVFASASTAPTPTIKSPGAEQLKLPMLDLQLPLSAFVIVAPLLIGAMYSYLVLYMRDLTSRVALYFEIANTEPKIPNAGRFLYPWVVVFALVAEHDRALDSRWDSAIKTLARLLTWWLGPIALFLLWTKLAINAGWSFLSPWLAMTISISMALFALGQSARKWQLFGFASLVVVLFAWSLLVNFGINLHSLTDLAKRAASIQRSNGPELSAVLGAGAAIAGAVMKALLEPNIARLFERLQRVWFRRK